MKYIQRFRPALVTGYAPENPEPLVRDPNGDYVKFEDYLEERRSLTHSRDNLSRIVGEIAALVKRDQNTETLLGAVERVMKANSKASEPGPAPSTSPSFPPTSEPRPGSL